MYVLEVVKSPRIPSIIAFLKTESMANETVCSDFWKLLTSSKNHIAKPENACERICIVLIYTHTVA
jgi:hypothetical protein